MKEDFRMIGMLVFFTGLVFVVSAAVFAPMLLVLWLLIKAL